MGQTPGVDRAARLRSLWSWLPVFRVVAETEHLPTASEVLHVTASSLSRTVRLLEEDVGQRLFEREGRGLTLNPAGEDLLRAVRDAMRRVDEALLQLGPGRMVGEVRVSVPGPFAPIYVLPALGVLAREHPRLHPRVVSVPDPEVAGALERGEIDVAVLEAAAPRDTLSLKTLAEVPHALCCGPTHPLAARRRPSAREIEAHVFVAPTALPDGAVPDRWPPELPRTIGLSVHQMQVGVDACASGAYLAVLPWPVAERAGLVRLRPLSSSALYVMHGPTLDPEGRTEAVVDALLSGPA